MMAFLMSRNRSGSLLIALICTSKILETAAADFWYVDFNDTTGILFNGDAATSSCGDGTAYAYSDLHYKNDASSISDVLEEFTAEQATQYSITNISTVTQDEIGLINSKYSAFGNRQVSQVAFRGECPVRARLTPSRPSRAGSMFRHERHPVLTGFETGFAFQISDQMRECMQVKDRNMSPRLYQACKVIGGDGFAFVVHGDEMGPRALGKNAAGLGYDGISHGVAVEFDFWTNTEQGYDDLWEDHISVQASTPSDRVLQAKWDGAIGPLKACNIADGLVHRVKIVYHGYIKYDLLEYFTMSPRAASLLRDDGDQRRLGTFVVYYDNMTAPVLAIPMNLDTALDLSQNQAYLGFTGSTGKSWAKQDILEWYFCEKPGCPSLYGDTRLIHYRPDQVGGNHNPLS